jgi:hypothetical protein
MKKILVAVFLLCTICCTENDIAGNKFAKYFRVDFQYGYHQSPTKLMLDNIIVLDDTLTTNDVLSLAQSQVIQVTEGDHHLRVQIDTVASETTFTITDSLVIGVFKNLQSGIVGFQLYQAGHLPAYD